MNKNQGSSGRVLAVKVQLQRKRKNWAKLVSGHFEHPLFESLYQQRAQQQRQALYTSISLILTELLKIQQQFAFLFEKPLSDCIKFDISHKKKDEKNFMNFHLKISENVLDQLCLATINFLEDIMKNLQMKTESYKKIKNIPAINIYEALFDYKKDDYDVQIIILQSYQNQYPMIKIVVNLKTCKQFSLYSNKEAEEIMNLYNMLLGRKFFKTQFSIDEMRNVTSISCNFPLSQIKFNHVVFLK
ncbi:unnamed protein product [Paramecium pentaurelia]|uniref:Uncharacterized protein n=1 Tax=Paramecium pentaurelia TaxID=43138 RepID=A0A8S1X038_9CILI|nr:unnamed protein product [Paramecium pentaurelia]